MRAGEPGQVVAHGKRRLTKIAERVLPLIADIGRAVRAREQELREAWRLLRQAGDLDPELAADITRDKRAPSVPIVQAVAGAEFVDDGVRPDARPAVRPGEGLGFAVQRAEIHETRAAVTAGRLERERVGVALLPAHARGERVARGQLLVTTCGGGESRD